NRRKSDWINLRQIGIALHYMHDLEGHFLPGASSLGNLPVEKSFSWMVAILPYIEQFNVYQAIDQTQPWDSPKNKWCADCSMRIYLRGCLQKPFVRVFKLVLAPDPLQWPADNNSSRIKAHQRQEGVRRGRMSIRLLNTFASTIAYAGEGLLKKF